MISTASHRLLTLAANITGTASSAQISMVVLRALLMLQPSFMNRDEPAATDAADVRQQIDGDQRRAEALELEAVALAQEVGQPEQEHPPDRVDQELAQGEGPRLAPGQQLEPADLLGRLGRVLLDIGQFGGPDA